MFKNKEKRRTKAGAVTSAEEHCEKNGEQANDFALKIFRFFTLINQGLRTDVSEICKYTSNKYWEKKNYLAKGSS